MIRQSGGLFAYWSALISLWRGVPGKQTLFNSAPGNSMARIFSIMGIYILCFGCAALLSFRLGRPGNSADRMKKIFSWVWIGPGLIFFVVIFLKFVNSGYLLVISPPVFVWLGLAASQWYSNVRLLNPAKITLIMGFAAINTLVFLYAPVYCSWASVRHSEAELVNVLTAVPQIAVPGDTLIVGFDSHFLGYRHAGYYLPAYTVAQYPEVHLAEGIRVFLMKDGDTRLAARLPAAAFKTFLFFPLPTNDTEYRDYMDALRARFPKGALRTVIAGGHEFSFGAMSDLWRLFPMAASDVYSGKDVAGVPVSPR